MNASKIKGDAGEAFVAEYLVQNGYRVIERNFHSRYGEIDIIAENRDFVVFVEVKARKGKSLVTALEAVNKSKQGKIAKTAMLYLQNYPTNLQPRFDVAEIVLKNNNVKFINYIENAFDIQTNSA